MNDDSEPQVCFPEMPFSRRCELCNGTNDQYFDKLDVRCRDCGDTTARAATVVCTGLFLFGIFLTAREQDMHWGSISRAASAVRKLIRRLRTIWRRAGMRFKVHAPK
jgi:hypothetical protein